MRCARTPRGLAPSFISVRQERLAHKSSGMRGEALAQAARLDCAGKNENLSRVERSHAVECSAGALSFPLSGWHCHLAGVSRLAGTSSGQ